MAKQKTAEGTPKRQTKAAKPKTLPYEVMIRLNRKTKLGGWLEQVGFLSERVYYVGRLDVESLPMYEVKNMFNKKQNVEVKFIKA